MEVWECEIKVLNALSEVGAGSAASVEGEGNTEREEKLKDMVDDIRSVIREYRDNKEKVKKSVSGGSTPNSKAKTRKRKTTDVEEEEEATSSDDAQSCTEHS